MADASREPKESRNRLFIELAALFVGMAVLVLEIAGARLLAPAFGSSIFVWTAQICTVLVALSLGYWYGGRKSEGRDAMQNAALMLFCACVSLSVALFFSNMLLALSAAFGAKLGPFIFSSFLFLLPCFFAGAMTPLLLRWYVSGIGQVGNDAGRLYAISTLGSLAGALLSAYFIVPFIGAKAGIWLTAASFGILGLAFAGKTRLHAVAAFAILLISSYSIAQETSLSVPVGFSVKESYDSEYYHFRIAENGTHRLLVLDADSHSMVEMGKAGLVFSYTKWMAGAGEAYFGKGRCGKTGMLGLGAGSLASHFAMQGCQVDAFEIDPKVYSAATEKFGLRSQPSLAVHVGDARALLAAKNYSFDILFVDAFASKYSIPIHLATREAFLEYSKAVPEGGIIVMNIISATSGPRSEMFRSISSTAREVFPYQAAIIGGSSENVQNVILVASKKPLPPALAGWALFGAKTQAEWEGGPILTDEKSTADYAMMAILG